MDNCEVNKTKDILIIFFDLNLCNFLKFLESRKEQVFYGSFRQCWTGLWHLALILLICIRQIRNLGIIWGRSCKAEERGKKAIIALARKLLVVIYTMLKQGPFDGSCFEARRKSCEQKQPSWYIRELGKRGCYVEAQA